MAEAHENDHHFAHTTTEEHVENDAADEDANTSVDDQVCGKIDTETADEPGIAKIAERISNQKFPFIASDDLSKWEDRQLSSWVEDYAMQIEHVELQSFIDKQYADYVHDNPMDSTLSKNVRKARWAYENYYFLAREFYLIRAMNGGDWVRYVHDGRLICLMPVQSLTQEEQSQVPVSAMSSVKKEHVQDINEKLKAKWNTITSLGA